MDLEIKFTMFTSIWRQSKRTIKTCFSSEQIWSLTTYCGFKEYVKKKYGAAGKICNISTLQIGSHTILSLLPECSGKIQTYKTVKRHTAWRYNIYSESPDRYCIEYVKCVAYCVI